MEDILAIMIDFLTVGGFFGVVGYAIQRGYNQSDKKYNLKIIKEERRLEEIKQENYLLENKQMRLELDKIKSERKDRLRLEEEKKNSKWLIEDSTKKKNIRKAQILYLRFIYSI